MFDHGFDCEVELVELVELVGAEPVEPEEVEPVEGVPHNTAAYAESRLLAARNSTKPASRNAAM
jgi:hypothetical protein